MARIRELLKNLESAIDDCSVLDHRFNNVDRIIHAISIINEIEDSINDIESNNCDAIDALDRIKKEVY